MWEAAATERVGQLWLSHFAQHVRRGTQDEAISPPGGPPRAYIHPTFTMPFCLVPLLPRLDTRPQPRRKRD